MGAADADATEHRQYLEALDHSVLQAAREGKTLDEMKQTITLNRFKHLGQYEAVAGTQRRGDVPTGEPAPPW